MQSALPLTIPTWMDLLIGLQVTLRAAFNIFSRCDIIKNNQRKIFWGGVRVGVGRINVEWTRKAGNLEGRVFLAVSKANKALFWPTSGFSLLHSSLLRGWQHLAGTDQLTKRDSSFSFLRLLISARHTACFLAYSWAGSAASNALCRRVEHPNGDEWLLFWIASVEKVLISITFI